MSAPVLSWRGAPNPLEPLLLSRDRKAQETGVCRWRCADAMTILPVPGLAHLGDQRVWRGQAKRELERAPEVADGASCRRGVWRWQLQMDGATAPFSRATSASHAKNANIITTFYGPSFGIFVAQTRIARQTWPIRPRPGRGQTLEDGYGRKHDSRR